MKIITLLTTLAASFAIGIHQEAKADTIVLPKYGFQIEPLDVSPSNAPAQALMTFLPPKNNFAANVNVQIQPYSQGIKNYITLSEGQFKQAGLQVVSEKQNADNEWVCEYSGDLQGRTLHFYSRRFLKETKYTLLPQQA